MRRALPAALAVCLAVAPVRAEVPSPSQFLKMPVGADRTLADYGQVTSYFRALAAASPRVQVEELGRTTNGQPLISRAASQ